MKIVIPLALYIIGERPVTIKKKSTLFAVKRHPSEEGNCSIHSPIEGGFKGGVPLFFITYLLIFCHIAREDPYTIHKHQTKMKSKIRHAMACRHII